MDHRLGMEERRRACGKELQEVLIRRTTMGTPKEVLSNENIWYLFTSTLMFNSSPYFTWSVSMEAFEQLTLEAYE